jgi:hypothetical protein
MDEIMDRMVDSLVKNKAPSEKKSYLIGLERGRIWADSADYFQMKEWSEENIEEFEDLVLPGEEATFFKVLQNETPIEWQPYIKGWIDGVKEVISTY